jgi:hypothetical protein
MFHYRTLSRKANLYTCPLPQSVFMMSKILLIATAVSSLLEQDWEKQLAVTGIIVQKNEF